MMLDSALDVKQIIKNKDDYLTKKKMFRTKTYITFNSLENKRKL